MSDASFEWARTTSIPRIMIVKWWPLVAPGGLLGTNGPCWGCIFYASGLPWLFLVAAADIKAGDRCFLEYGPHYSGPIIEAEEAWLKRFTETRHIVQVRAMITKRLLNPQIVSYGISIVNTNPKTSPQIQAQFAGVASHET